MGFVSGADEHAKPEVRGCGGDGKVVGRNEPALSGQGREEVGPALGDLGTELDDRDPGDEAIDLGAPGGSARRAVCQPDARQQFRVDDRRDGRRFIGDVREGVLPRAG
jgi:hypothetical protein